MSHSFRNILLVSIALLIAISYGCKTTEQTVPDDSPISTDTDTEATVSDEDISELQKLLNENRNSLSDIYLSQNHDMPDAFLKTDTSSESLNQNPYDGYRIQILSTRELAVADSVAASFRTWSDTTITGYNAKAYVSFRQPYFKVHIGDFQQRDQANSFTQLIKRKYPDAWVVHDRISPSNVPADTASFSFGKQDTTKKNSPEQQVQEKE